MPTDPLDLDLVYSSYTLAQNISPCQVECTYTDANGTPLSGSVQFIPAPQSIADPDTGTIIVPTPITATLDNSGSINVTIYASDDADLNPNGWTYTVVESLKNADGSAHTNTYNIEAPGNTVINLADEIPVASYNGSPITRGRPGPQGPGSTVQGPVGPANTLSAGTATVLPAGSAPTVSITGTSPSQVLNLGIPAGPQGTPGVPSTAGLFKPSYVTSNVQNTFSPLHNIYNMRGQTALWWRGAISAASSYIGTNQLTSALFCNDSGLSWSNQTSSGTGTLMGDNSYVYQLLAMLGRAGIAIAGKGIVPVVADTSYFNAGYSATAGWNKSGTTAYSTNSTGILTYNYNDARFPLNLNSGAGATMNVIWQDGPNAGPFNVNVTGTGSGSINGNVTPNNPTGLAWKRTAIGFNATTNPVTALSIAIQATTSNPVRIFGIEISNGTGLKFHNMSFEASSASTGTVVSNASYDQTTSDFDSMRDILTSSIYGTSARSATFFSCIFNDYLNGNSTFASWKASVTSFANQLNNQNFFLVIPPMQVGNSTGTWGPWVNAAYELADTLNVPLIDLGYRYNSFVNTGLLSGAGLATDAYGHPNAAGHYDIARNIHLGTWV